MGQWQPMVEAALNNVNSLVYNEIIGICFKLLFGLFKRLCHGVNYGK